MKIKSDFVTNSSSASFVISKDDLTDLQIMLIHNHFEVGIAVLEREGKRSNWIINAWDEWNVRESKNEINGYTTMDNFDMMWYLTKIIRIPREKIKYDDHIANRSSQIHNEFSRLCQFIRSLNGSPCNKCLIAPVCTSSFLRGTACDEYRKFIYEILDKIKEIREA